MGFDKLHFFLSDAPQDQVIFSPHDSPDHPTQVYRKGESERGEQLSNLRSIDRSTEIIIFIIDIKREELIMYKIYTRKELYTSM